MKGGYFYERRTKQLSLFFIGVVFTTLLPSHGQVVQLFPGPVITPSLDIQGNESSRTHQEKHKENTTNIVENPVSSHVFEQYKESKPPKQQFLEPMSPKNLGSNMETEEISVPIANDEKQVCNYGKGKWVVDNNRPLYSGFGCKQWLSGIWACRLTQRTDFGFEKLRWQPKDCKMDDFNADKFLKRIQDKTIAFIGDSISREQFQSLMCMLTGGKERYDVQDVGKEYGLVKARKSIRPDGWAYRFPPTNTTILYYWSASLCDLTPIDPQNPSTFYAMHLDKPPSFLKRYISKFHVLILNTGRHWNKGKINSNKWIMYLNGTRVRDKKVLEINNAKNLTVYSVVKWVDEAMGKYAGLKAFYRSISPGNFNTGGMCDKTTPGELEIFKESRDVTAEGAVRGTKVKLLDVTRLSEVREEGRIPRHGVKGTWGMQDCVHWCLPGIPDTWNELLFAQI